MSKDWLVDQDIYSLVLALWEAPLTKLRDVALRFGPVNPVGDGDSKTASPSTYRPVGPTCPDGSSEHIGRCPYLGSGCYAEGGNVAIHARRSQDEVWASISAAAVGMVWALKTERLCRLHVSGDFVQGGRVDHRYIAQLGVLADAVNAIAGRAKGSMIAWSYTHIPARTFAPYRKVLERHGIAVRFSDHSGENGVIVAPFDEIPAGIRYAKCPAQLPQGRNCADCTLCWTLPSHTIVFEPHGASKNKARAAALRVMA